MGIVQNIIGMVHDIHDRQSAAQIKDAEKNYMNDPDAAIKAVFQIDPNSGMALQRQHAADQAAALAAKQNAGNYTLSTVRNMLRGLPEGSDYGAAFDNMAPAIQAMGIDPTHAGAFRSAIVANPNVLMDDKAYEAWAHDQNSSVVATPGSHVLRAGKVIDSVPFAIKAVTTPAGATSVPFDQNTGRFATPGAPAAPVNAPPYPPGATSANPTAVTVANMMPVLHAGESAGSGDYTATNASGAMGKYQVMPKDGQRAAKALGLAWRPDMMVKDDPASRNYQEAIGAHRAQESVDASGGDPAKFFSHYYSGSTTAYLNPKGNPKTAAYVQKMLGLMPGGAPGQATANAAPTAPSITPTSVSVPPKPAKPAITYRDATPQEIKAAGYPDGTAAQVDGNGKMVNLKVPTAAAQKQAPSFEKYNESAAGLDELEHNLIRLRDDPHLATTGTGLIGSIAAHFPGTHRQYLQGLTDTINSQKTISLLSSLQASGGNPFTRVTNMEAQLLPKTLGNFSLSQSADDLKANINHAIQNVHQLRSRVRDAGIHAGVIDAQGNRVEPGSAPAAPASTAPNPPVRARDAHGVLHQLIPGQDPSNPASWRTVQ